MTPERKGVVITGASRGIGAQLSKAYRHIGYQVIASSRSMRTSDDPAILVIEGDITRPERPAAFFWASLPSASDYAIDRIYQIRESFHGNRLYANATAT